MAFVFPRAAAEKRRKSLARGRPTSLSGRRPLSLSLSAGLYWPLSGARARVLLNFSQLFALFFFFGAAAENDFPVAKSGVNYSERRGVYIVSERGGCRIVEF